jgi:hypothetical protein
VSAFVLQDPVCCRAWAAWCSLYLLQLLLLPLLHHVLHTPHLKWSRVPWEDIWRVEVHKLVDSRVGNAELDDSCIHGVWVGRGWQAG